PFLRDLILSTLIALSAFNTFLKSSLLLIIIVLCLCLAALLFDDTKIRAFLILSILFQKYFQIIFEKDRYATNTGQKWLTLHDCQPRLSDAMCSHAPVGSN
ncbi:MAG: hypothetical protein ACRC1D_03115, partial [Culicoidibacterales bacterium]